MEKRGQITLFILIGMVIFIFLIFIMFLKMRVIEQTSEHELKKSVQRGLDRNSIVYFIEDCLRQAGEKGVFTRIGPQGGYVDPVGDEDYGEDGTAEIGGLYSPFGDAEGDEYQEKVPYYVDGSDTFIPSLTAIEKKLANFVIVEFEDCADFSEYENSGYNITKPEIDYALNNFDFGVLPVDVNVSINPKDVVIRLHYPLEFRRKSEFIKVSDFSTAIPVNLGTLYINATHMAEEIANDADYNISLHCTEYDFNGLINIYFKNNQFVEFLDYSSHDKLYQRGFPFRFGVDNREVSGSCVDES